MKNGVTNVTPNNNNWSWLCRTLKQRLQKNTTARQLVRDGWLSRNERSSTRHIQGGRRFCQWIQNYVLYKTIVVCGNPHSKVNLNHSRL